MPNPGGMVFCHGLRIILVPVVTEIQMSINILYGNLQPHLWETISDSIRFVRAALTANGVSTRVGTNQLDPKSINLFFDRFYEEPALPTILKAGGMRYGLVCTESIAPDGTWNFGAEGDNQENRTSFELAARQADFVWCMLEQSVDYCRSLNPRTAFLPFGYLDEMETLADVAWPERDIDLLLCGLPSPRRDTIMAGLASQGYRTCYPAMAVPLTVRDMLMERSRLSLSIQKTDRHDIVSVTRISHSVINRVPILLETADVDNRLSRYCLVAEPGSVAQTAARHLRETDLEAWAKARYDEFKAEMPMASAMRRVLDATTNL